MKNPFIIAGVTTTLIFAGAVALSLRQHQPEQSAQHTEQSESSAHASPVSWQVYDKGLSQSQSEKKHTMVQFFATWCGYCRKMDTEVFNQPEVMGEIEQHFVPVRVTESSINKVKYEGQDITERELTLKHGISGYPTFVFLKPNGEVITKLPGYVDAKQMQGILKFIGTGAYEKMDYATFEKQLAAS